MQVKTGRKKQQAKSSLNVSIRSKLKQQVKEEIKYSSITFSQLMEEKLIEFLEEQSSLDPEVKFEEMDEYACPECEAMVTDAVLDKKTEGDCPICGHSIK